MTASEDRSRKCFLLMVREPLASTHCRPHSKQTCIAT